MALAMTQVSENYYDVGSFDAKTYFAELLRNVMDGKKIRITKNGKPVAVMQSPQKAANSEAMASLYKLKKIGLEVAEKSDGYKLSVQDIQNLKNEGRKY